MSRLLKIKNNGDAYSLKGQTKHMPPIPRNYKKEVKTNDLTSPLSHKRIIMVNLQ